MLKLENIFIYPVKSLGAISLGHCKIEERGLEYDRRWMLINRDGVFMTQRDYPQMSFIKMKFEGTRLIAYNNKDDSDRMEIPLDSAENELIRVGIWEDNCEAVFVGASYDKWFSEHLGIECRLVKMPETTKRQIDLSFAEEGKYVSFADGFPFLLIGTASLEDLNDRLEEPVPMSRFRPNFVMSGGKPYEEDQLNEILIGDVRFKVVKPCSRCVITTLDEKTGVKGKEPLKTLSGYRKKGNKVFFGQNLIAYSAGTVTIGDKIRQL